MAHLLSLLLPKRYVVYYMFHILLTWLCVTRSVAAAESACEVRYFDAPPPSPPNFAKMEELVQATARQMAHSIGQYLESMPEEAIPLRHPDIKAKAVEIARTALKERPTILASGIAAAFVPFAVIQFQNALVVQANAAADSEETQKKREFLATYWRVMGAAWNRTSNTEQWGFPFRDCGPLKERWLWPYTATVQANRFKIVTAIFIPADSDPCIDSPLAVEIFGRRHACNRDTETCSPVHHNHPTSTSSSNSESVAARTDSYVCDCRPGYVKQETSQQLVMDPSSLSSSSPSNSSGSSESLANNSATVAALAVCVPCHQGSPACNSSSLENYNAILSEMDFDATHLSLETLMRATIGAILGTCILSAVGLGLLVYRKRKFKSIAMSMWTILEVMILGTLIMYGAVLLHFLEASTLRCLLEPWLRELGFVICYGAITLKLYRHLIEFRTRKAHRWVVRDLDLLKYLCAMIVAVLCYLSAFTASSLDFVEHSQLDGLEVEHNLCRPLKWDYVTEAGEMAILVFGLYLSYITRNAKTMFQERNFLVAAIIIEFVVSINFYIFRAVYMDRLSAQILFLCLFVRSQLTNTVTLGIIFLPKLLHPMKKGMNESAFRSGTSGGPNLSADPDIGEVTLSEMNPEEIRKELKRLYTQLEILKNKTLRLDNPHISKRRGGRKTHRRFSLQKKGSKDKALHAKHRAHPPHDAEITEAEPSRTPEDSVCSVEGPTEVVSTK